MSDPIIIDHLDTFTREPRANDENTRYQIALIRHAWTALANQQLNARPCTCGSAHCLVGIAERRVCWRQPVILNGNVMIHPVTINYVSSTIDLNGVVPDIKP